MVRNNLQEIKRIIKIVTMLIHLQGKFLYNCLFELIGRADVSL
jgi:hypothetical protein